MCWLGVASCSCYVAQSRSASKRRRRLDFDAILEQYEPMVELRQKCVQLEGEPAGGAILGLALIGPGGEVSSLLDRISLQQRICMQYFGWQCDMSFAAVLDAAVLHPPVVLGLAGHRNASLVRLTPLERCWVPDAMLFTGRAELSLPHLLRSWGFSDDVAALAAIPVWSLPPSLVNGERKYKGWARLGRGRGIGQMRWVLGARRKYKGWARSVDEVGSRCTEKVQGVGEVGGLDR